MGTQLPLPQRGTAPLQFSANICCGQIAGWINMPLGMEVGLGPGDRVRCGSSSPLQKGAEPPPQFLAHVYCGQNGWMNQDPTWHRGEPWSRPHYARWGPSSPPPKGADPPIFGTCLVWPNGWMDQDAWYGGMPGPRRHCVRWGLSSPPLKGHSPQFSDNVHLFKLPDGLRCHLVWR